MVDRREGNSGFNFAPVLVGLVLVGVAVGLFLMYGRPKQGASGNITKVFAMEQASKESVLAGVEFTVKNLADEPLWVKQMKVKIKTAKGEFEDEPASVSDAARYFEAFPELKSQASNEFMPIDSKIAEGAERKVLVVVSFPVTKAEFDARQGIEVLLEPHDRTPMVIK